MGAFLGGMAEGAGKELSNQQDIAFRLKLQNRQIEAQMQAADQEYQRSFVTPETKNLLQSQLPDLAGLKDRNLTVGEAGLLAGLIRSKQAAESRQNSRLGRDSIAGVDANKGLGAEYFKPNEPVTRLGYQVAQGRINKETGSAELGKAYAELKSGLENLKKLNELRDTADHAGPDELDAKPLSPTGPFMGRLGKLVGKVSGGKKAGSNLELESQIKMIAPAVAKAAGHVGNLNVQEVQAAVEGIGNSSVDRKVAKRILTRLLGQFDTKISEIEKQYPQLARQAQNQNGNAIAALDGKKTKTPYDDLSPVEKLMLLQQTKKAYEDAIKNRQAAKPQGN